MEEDNIILSKDPKERYNLQEKDDTMTLYAQVL